MEFWEEGIDIDDTDLPSLFPPLPSPSPSASPSHSPSSINPTLPLSLPSLHPCSQIPRPPQTLNPNPNPNPPPKNSVAPPLIPGPAGAVQASMHRRSAANAAAVRSPLPNPEVRDGIGSDLSEEEDGDFKLNPWLCAMNFLGLRMGFTSPSPISSIKNQRSAADRIPKVVGVVKSCMPNGLGDLSVTLKDPTGTISASIHRKVILDNRLSGDISVGCVLILEKVVAFCLARSACYLNVTPKNVVKIFSKDCEPPHNQKMPSCTAVSGACRRHMEFGQTPAERPLVREGAEATACNAVKRHFTTERMMDSTKTVVAGNLICSTSATDATTNMAAKPDPRTSEPKKLISSVAQWTDEQLSELMFDYQDDILNFT